MFLFLHPREHGETGQGVAQDSVQAIAWYHKAAALGDDYAKKRLAALGIQ